MAAGDRLIYAVRTECGMTAGLVDRGGLGLQIRIKGAGWAPDRIASREAGLRRLLDMKTYTPAEVEMARAVCRPTPP